MMQIMEGNASDAQIASFITALRMKGETVEEITGCAMAMRRKAVKIKAGNGIIVDTCGTGGDAKNTFSNFTRDFDVIKSANICYSSCRQDFKPHISFIKFYLFSFTIKNKSS